MPITTRNDANYGPAVTISVGASPFTFTNTENVPINVMVSGGTVTTISLSADGASFTALGLLGGQYHLNPGQALQVVYILAPAMVYLPV